MNGPIERKVTWSTLTAYLVTVALLAILDAVSADPSLASPLPDVVEVPFISALPALIVLLAGLRAKHTPRPDLPLTDGKTPGTR